MRPGSSKLRAMVLAIAVAALVGLAPRAAKACGSGASVLAVIIAAAVPVVAADVTFTGYDLGTAALDERASNGWATAEIGVAAPQFILGGMAVANSRSNDALIVSGFYTLWMAALTGHGVVTLATSPPQASDKPAPTPPPPSENLFAHGRWSVAPTLLTDGRQNALIPGIGAAGTF